MTIRRRLKTSQGAAALVARPDWSVPAIWALLFVGSILILMLPGIAHAQAGIAEMLGATPRTDESVKILNSALGGGFFLNPFSAVGGPTTLMGGLLILFNGAFFMLALVWGGWNIGRGIIGTAHEGQVLGQRLHPVWMPLRMVTGIVSIVPVFGGFNLGQVILVVVSSIGVGLANLMLVGALRMTADFVPSVGDPTAVSRLRDAAYGLFTTEVCKFAKQDEERAAVAGGAPPHPQDLLRVTPLRPTEAAPIAHVGYGTLGTPLYCGRVAMFGKLADRAPSMVGFRVSAVNYAAIATDVQRGYRASWPAFDAQLRLLAQTWYTERLRSQATPATPLAPVPTDAIEAAATQFAASVQRGAQGARDNIDSEGIKRATLMQMREYGWAGLGAWFATFSEVNAALADAVNAIEMKVEEPRGYTNSSMMTEAMAVLSKSTDQGRATAKRAASDGDGAWGAIKSFVGDAMGVPTNIAGEWSIGQALLQKMIGGVGAGAGGGTLHNPIIMMKNTGDYLMVFGQSIHAGIGLSNLIPGGGEGGLLAKAAGAVAKVPGAGIIGKMGGALLAILPMVATVMIGIGMIMAIYIPMIPFITWMGGMVQWVVIFFEGMLAVTLGAFAHMEAEGEGMGQRSERIYIFILNMLARPALMVFGFFAATALLMAIGTFQVHMFMGAVANAQGNSLTGLLSIIGFIFIFMVLNFTLIQGLFNMITIFPDQVIGYVGQGHTSDIGKETEGKIHGMFLGLGRRLDGGMGALAGGGGRGGGGGGGGGAGRLASAVTGAATGAKAGPVGAVVGAVGGGVRN